MIKVYAGGMERVPDALKDVRLFAYTPNQARLFFIRRYPYLRDYLEMGYEVEARLDQQQWDEILQFQKNKKEREEQIIQDAWWNQ